MPPRTNLIAKGGRCAIAFGWALAWPTAPAFAQNASARCPVTILTGDGLSASWLDAAAQLRADLATRDDCARVTLEITADGDGARLVATAANGKQAARNVAHVSSLRPLALGLVTSIPVEAPAPRPIDEAPSPLEIPPDEPIIPPVPKPPTARPKPRLVGSLLVGSRLGMPTRVLAVDATLRADVFVDDWFLVASVRVAPAGMSLVEPSIPAYVYQEVSLGIGLGRRFYAGPVLFDLALAPSIVTMTEEGDIPADGAGGTDDELRCDLSLRALFGSTRWRPAVMIDFEVAPYALGKPVPADTMLPPFPTWTVGLGAGISGDLL